MLCLEYYYLRRHEGIPEANRGPRGEHQTGGDKTLGLQPSPVAALQIEDEKAQLDRGTVFNVRTSEDCEKRWYVLQSKAREEIAAHKRESSRTGGGPPAKQLSQVAQTVFNIFGQSGTSITGLKEGTDSSMIQLVELQKCSQSLQQRKGDRRHRKWATLSLERLILCLLLQHPL
ncbi:hypothetical protein DPEC_G00155480 [Dallia pectoralis]|uniref:Uncharacterized protein n=1 Tax=Dallia pectoralis TaxID=75939 RepID=A0ACC2GKY6_DALPE|nr:hypothetical protein DPEC_G00155480 [Dallia pectoralis]